MKERGGEERGGGGKGWMVAIARARYKLHLNRSRGTRGIRNLNGHRGGGGGGRREKDLANLVDREEKQESETKRRKEAKSSILKWRWNRIPPPCPTAKILMPRFTGWRRSCPRRNLRWSTRFYPEDISIGCPFLTPIFINILRWRRVSFLFKLHVPAFSRKRFSDIIPFLKNIRQRFDKKHFPKIKLY